MWYNIGMEDLTRYHNRMRELYPERYANTEGESADDSAPILTYTASEVAEILGLTKGTVAKYVKIGELEGEFIGNRYHITESAIERFKGRKPKKRYPRQTKKAIRELVLKRDKCCVMCKSEESLEVHHIKYRSEGGKDEMNNLITLCNKCHAMQHEGEPIHNLMMKRIADCST